MRKRWTSPPPPATAPMPTPGGGGGDKREPPAACDQNPEMSCLHLPDIETFTPTPRRERARLGTPGTPSYTPLPHRRGGTPAREHMKRATNTLTPILTDASQPAQSYTPLSLLDWNRKSNGSIKKAQKCGNTGSLCLDEPVRERERESNGLFSLTECPRHRHFHPLVQHVVFNQSSANFMDS